MKNQFLYYTYWGAIFISFSLTTVHAAELNCAAAPDCETLGYTMASNECLEGIQVKCPTDPSKVYCKKKVAETCQVGSILFNDKSCSTSLQAGKMPIGVVFDADEHLAVALNEKKLAWQIGNEEVKNVDIPNLENCSNEKTCTTNGKQNTAAILEFGKLFRYSYPAAEYCVAYAVTVDNTSYDTDSWYVPDNTWFAAGTWFLPSFEELYALYTNQVPVNTTLTKINATPLTPDNYWSSNEIDGHWVYYKPMDATHNGKGSKGLDSYTRPVVQY